MGISEEITQIGELLKALSAALPDGENNMEIGDKVIKLMKGESGIKIEIEPSKEKKWDDSDIVEQVENFKELLEELDDELFVNATEQARKGKLDLIKMDSLLSQEHYTEEESYEIEDMMGYFSYVIRQTIQEKIDSLQDLYNEF